MRTPKEILELQEQFIARSKKALTQVCDDKLIAWNSLRLIQNTLMAWLMAKRHDLNFQLEEVRLSTLKLEENFAEISEQSESNYTFYLLACMICNKNPDAKIIEFVKTRVHDIDFLLDSSVVPYVYFGLASSDKVLSTIESRTKNLSIESAIIYLNLLSLDSDPSAEVIEHLTALYLRRKRDCFYSEARLYGGGVDNDMVCDVEFAAISSAKGFSTLVVPAVNKRV